MLRFILLSILLTIVYRALSRLWAGIVRGMQEQAGRGPQFRPGSAPARSVQMARDPVCGTFVVPEKAVALSTPDGSRVYFCSTDCRDTFRTRADAVPSTPRGRTA